jgi:hypothetical protein
LNLTISPLTYTTGASQSTATITASIASGSSLDDATAVLNVVNPKIKSTVGTSIDVEMPNFIADVLSKVGLADKVELKLKNSLGYGLNCCSYSSIRKAPELKIFVELGAEAGPFTIVGIPLPPSVKNYVTLDLLNLILSGSGKAEITANHDSCIPATTVAGGGAITGEVDLGGELKLKTFRVLVLEVRISGSTSITENFFPAGNGMINASASWGGLTGTVRGKLIVFGKTIEIVPTSRTYFEEDNILPIQIPIPNFYDALL